jgi:predicted enzyme related to lactoylglutathione lyase
MTDSKYGPPAINHILLELHVPDFEIAKSFYQKLGFEVVWERAPEGFKGYLVLKQQDNILCFWGGNQAIYQHEYFHKWENSSKRGYGVEIVLMVNDVDLAYEKAKNFATIVEELTLKPWGLRDFRIEDPFGYYIRLTKYHNILDSRNAVK